jgi:hypothetical protein
MPVFIGILIFVVGMVIYAKFDKIEAWFTGWLDRPNCGLDPTAERVLKRQIAEGRYDAAFGPRLAELGGPTEEETHGSEDQTRS